MNEDFKKRLEEDDGFIVLDTDPSQTDAEYQYLLFLCEQGVPIGFGALDSFLSGADIEKRVSMIEREAKQNEYLRGELIDTLSLNQSKDWTQDQLQRLCRAAGRSRL